MPWENLISKTVTRGTGESLSTSTNSNNQFVGWTYDRGNARNTPGGQYDNHFNAENQWIWQNTFGVSYLYDGDGERVKAWGGASGTRVYWKDESGRVLAESGTNSIDYFYLNGQMVARATGRDSG